MRRLRPLSEAECYARCYGARGEDVRVVELEGRRRRAGARLGEPEIRRLLFEPPRRLEAA